MLGAIYFVVVIVASFVIKTAPADYRPTGFVPQTRGGKPLPQKNWVAMLHSPYFYFIFFMMFTGAFSGLMIASNASVIGQQMFQLSAGVAAMYVSLYSLANCLGRVLWGTVSDKLGRNRTLMFILVVIIIAFVLLMTLSGAAGFALGVIILGLCFGGVMGIFPALVMENFGPVNQGVNYGIVFCGYSIAAFFGPKIAVSMASHGDFSKAFYAAIAIAIVGVVLNAIYMVMKRQAQNSR